MTAGEHAFLVLAIGPNTILSPEIVALPRMALQPPVPEMAPSAPTSRIVCRRSITPPPRMLSASQRPTGWSAGVCANPTLVVASNRTAQNSLLSFFKVALRLVPIAEIGGRFRAGRFRVYSKPFHGYPMQV